MIYVCEPYLGKREQEAALECLRRGEISGTSGRFIQEFEQRFSNFCSVRYGVSTTSGTTALHLALASLGIKAGDEVIVSNLTNIATVYSIVYTGARPVLVDSEDKTWNIDAGKIEGKINKRTKAILVVHLYGHPAEMDEIMRIKRKYNLYLIEDAAEAHGAEYKNKKVGSFADIGCFSFYANKIITTGEGGMLVTDNKRIYERAQLLKNLAFSRKRRFKHFHIGFNYRMSNLQAAIGLKQLERIRYFINRKIKNAHFYNRLLGEVEGIVLPPCQPYVKNVYWMYCILVNDNFGLSRDKLMQRLKEKNIETRTFFIPMHLQPIFRKIGLFRNEKHPVCERLSRQGLYLPSGVNLSVEQIAYVCEQIKKIQKKG